jgi:hypothetical protein
MPKYRLIVTFNSDNNEDAEKFHSDVMGYNREVIRFEITELYRVEHRTTYKDV